MYLTGCGFASGSGLCTVCKADTRTVTAEDVLIPKLAAPAVPGMAPSEPDSFSECFSIKRSKFFSYNAVKVK